MKAPLARIHIDPIGGLAGDMFVAAVADAWPDCIEGLIEELRRLPLPAGTDIRLVPHTDGTLSGSRFLVGVSDRGGRSLHSPVRKGGSTRTQEPSLAFHDRHAEHRHTPYRVLRDVVSQSQIGSAVKEHALGMFALLATAEASIHGVAPDDVEFHEVGAWDSLVDLVGAAYIIDTLSPRRWTWAPPPIGSGRVSTAHGVLPIPAPATVLLLQGMAVMDDGVPGERVTPTGAVILKYLAALSQSVRIADQSPDLVISGTGFGFGARALPGLPNVARCILFAEAEAATRATAHRDVVAVQFEIDDQTAEDLAAGLDCVRGLPGVLEIYQAPVYGKKGRLAIQVQVLSLPDAAEAVMDACFQETTTLGLRFSHVRRRTLSRSMVQVQGEQDAWVKVAERPGGARTAKAEMDDLSKLGGDKAARDRLRRHVESQALESKKGNEHDVG